MGRAAVIFRSGLWPASDPGPGRPLAGFQGHGGLCPPWPPGGRPVADLLDHDWYVSNYPDITAAPLSPLVHYLLAGGRENRTPHPLFDAVFYVGHSGAESNYRPDPAGTLRPHRRGPGRDPHPLFSIEHYVAQHRAGEQRRPIR